MQEEAIRKINEEMQKSPNDKALEAIGHYVIDLAASMDSAAASVLKEGKTLKGCMDEVRSRAKKQAQNGMAMIEDREVFSWVDEYFGFMKGGRGYSAAATTGPSKTSSLNLDFSDFL